MDFNTHVFMGVYRRTLFYELFSGQFPFRGLRLEEILWQVCSANRQTLVNISCNTVLKVGET